MSASSVGLALRGGDPGWLAPPRARAPCASAELLPPQQRSSSQSPSALQNRGCWDRALLMKGQKHQG